MIDKDFKIYPKKKLIIHNPKGSKIKYSLNDFYSFLQDLFDEPKYMKYDIPISANSKKQYSIINGWEIDTKTLKYLKNGTLRIEKTIILP